MYTIILTERFKQDIKYYEQKKKFKHIDKDIGKVIVNLLEGELIGDIVPRSRI